jgi:hypothetical protein
MRTSFQAQVSTDSSSFSQILRRSSVSTSKRDIVIRVTNANSVMI